MRKILYILLFIPLGLSAQTNYYVRWDGNDSNTGTGTATNQAWKTIQHGLENITAGDTLFVMDDGGSFMPTGQTHGSDIYYWYPDDGYGSTGTSGNPIVIINYPGDTPIIDFDNVVEVSDYNVGFYIEDVHYVHIKGLTFQNLDTTSSTGPVVQVFDIRSCSNWTFEELVIRDNGGVGLRFLSGIGDDVGIATDTTKFLNNDIWRNKNNGGNHADGIKYDQDKGAYAYFYGNRIFWNSDDGIDASGSALRVFYKNWVWGSGQDTLGVVPGGNGAGFKTGTVRDTLDHPSVLLYKNLSAYNQTSINDGMGFDIVDYQVSDTSYRRANARFYGNTAYHNDYGFVAFSNPLWTFRNSTFRNNISYDAQYIQDDQSIDVQILTYEYPESHNTWDWESGGFNFLPTDSVTLEDASFVIIDSTTAITQMMGARVDGELPTITFLNLANTSDMIDAGTQVQASDSVGDILQLFLGTDTLDYNGTAPDLGYAEYSAGSATVPTVIISSVDAVKAGEFTLTGNCNDDGGGTVSARGFCYATTENPDLGDTVVTNGSGTGSYQSTISGLTAAETYYIRAYATNEEGTAYSSQETIVTLSSTSVGSGGKWVVINGKIVYY